MTVVLPDDYHARKALEDRNILCKSQKEALAEDIRALRIGILNIMPHADTYEFNILQPLGRSIIQIEPIWIRLETHAYKSTNHDHLDHLYETFRGSIENDNIDGLIITGAPVEEIPFENITYWDEIRRIVNYARNNIVSTMGICWGAIALAEILEIPPVHFKKKLFGVYKVKNLNTSHRITAGMDDYFWCPQSRHAGIEDSVMEKARDDGKINLLAHGVECGYTIFESSDHRFLMHLGHPEYNKGRLIDEYNRDKIKFPQSVLKPYNFNLENPVNIWRGHRTEFFNQWIRFIHEMTNY